MDESPLFYFLSLRGAQATKQSQAFKNIERCARRTADEESNYIIRRAKIYEYRFVLAKNDSFA